MLWTLVPCSRDMINFSSNPVANFCELSGVSVSFDASRLSSKWGCSSVGRAPPLHGGGQGFESPQLHQLRMALFTSSLYVCYDTTEYTESIQEASMEAKNLILGILEQSQGYLTKALDGLTQEEAAWSPRVQCNSIVFTFWHIIRVEDFFVTRVIQRQVELYEAKDWRQKLGTPAKETGYQYTAEQLQDWPVPKLEVLRGYASSVRENTLAFLKNLTPEKLSTLARPDRPPDTIGAILVRISTEISLHVGQIAYLRGIQRGLGK